MSYLSQPTSRTKHISLKHAYLCPLITASILLMDSACVTGSESVGENQAAALGSPSQNIDPPDLTFQVPIKAGSYEYALYKATIPGFAVSEAKLKPRSNKTRLMIGVKFTSRAVQSARLKITLLKSFGEPETIGHIAHVEALGPERVVTKGRNLDLVRKWDDWRALWFDLSLDARMAEAIRVDVHLQ